MAPDIKFFLTASLICNGPVKFLYLGSKIIKIIILILNALRAVKLLKAYPNLLNAHSKYGVSCSIYITKVDCVALGTYMIK